MRALESIWRCRLAGAFVIGTLSFGTFAADAEAPAAAGQTLELSPTLLDLLRAEMREVAVGVSSIATSLAAADWPAVERTSSNIRASYIMDKALTPELANELDRALPGPFKQLDAEFHARATKLGTAAAAHDAELAAFHFSRLVESCVVCHSAYATARFPGFVAEVPAEHRH